MHRFVAEPQLVAASVKTLSKDDTDLLRCLEGSPTYTLTYEELVGATDYREILEFLGVSEYALASPFSRQRSAVRQRDALENYDELMAYFNGTDMERYFVE